MLKENPDSQIPIPSSAHQQEVPLPPTLVTSQNQFYLIWENIFYEVQVKGAKSNTKILINNITGYAKSGELTAIMGPSGCGKTSLLNFLNDKIQWPPGSKHDGKIFLNSEEITPSQVSSLASIVMQDDMLFDVLTPKETLKFVAKLKFKKTDEEYESSVEDLLKELNLLKCKDVRIGNERIKGISGGERKRTSIGVEIMSNPKMLFLDEPTSGLDSTTSGVVMEFLKNLAKKKNMVIVFTIHQPSSNIFRLFDWLLIINKGSLAYQGIVEYTNNNKEGIVPYFENVLNHPLSNKVNPSDAFMHIIEEQNDKIEKGIIPEADSIVSQYQGLKKQIDMEIQNIKDQGQKCTVPPKNLQNVGFCGEFVVLCHRTWINMIRNPATLRTRAVMVFMFSFIALSIFYNMGNDLLGCYNKQGFFFFFSVNNTMSIMFGAVMTFPMERGVFKREYGNKLYGVAPYYLSKNLIETPITLFSVLLFGIIVYHLAGLRSDDTSKFFIFLCIFVVLAWHSQSLGLFFGSMFSNFHTALILTQFSMLPLILFSGLLINQDNMPAWLAWIRFFSPFRYSIEAGLKNEFEDNPLAVVNPAANLNLDMGLWNCVIIMMCWGIGLRIAGGFLLKALVTKEG